MPNFGSKVVPVRIPIGIGFLVAAICLFTNSATIIVSVLVLIAAVTLFAPKLCQSSAKGIWRRVLWPSLRSLGRTAWAEIKSSWRKIQLRAIHSRMVRKSGISKETKRRIFNSLVAIVVMLGFICFWRYRPAQLLCIVILLLVLSHIFEVMKWLVLAGVIILAILFYQNLKNPANLRSGTGFVSRHVPIRPEQSTFPQPLATQVPTSAQSVPEHNAQINQPDSPIERTWQIDGSVATANINVANTTEFQIPSEISKQPTMRIDASGQYALDCQQSYSGPEGIYTTEDTSNFQHPELRPGTVFVSFPGSNTPMLVVGSEAFHSSKVGTITISVNKDNKQPPCGELKITLTPVP